MCKLTSDFDVYTVGANFVFGGLLCFNQCWLIILPFALVFGVFVSFFRVGGDLLRFIFSSYL